MKILEMTLTNFSRIFSGLGKTSIKLDFRKVDEKINLFVGPNGSGKTSIENCLHPFAYNNSMGDSTTNSSLIIEGKDGKKTITILADDGKVYYIQHVYTRKKDGTIAVKSYIREDNEELNDSGTVSTFKEIVLDKLGVDETYLTLLSISNSVKGFVEFTAGERKGYASKIFTELELYNKKYKEISVSYRNMKSILDNVTSKLSKFSNVNREQLQDTMNEINVNINLLTSKKNQLSVSIGGLQSQLDSFRNDITSYNDLSTGLTRLLNNIQVVKSKITTNLPLDKLTREMDDIKSSITTKTIIQTELKENINSKLDLISSKRTNLENVNLNMSKMTACGNINELEILKTELTNKVNAIKTSYDVNMKFPLNKTDMIKCVIYLDELKNICDNLIFDVINQDSILPLFEEYIKHTNLYAEIESKYVETDNELKRMSAINNQPIMSSSFTIRDDSCSNPNCPYKAFYETYKNFIFSSQDENNVKMNDLQRKVSKLEDALRVLNIFTKAFDHIDRYGSLINVLPDNIFNKDTFIELYMMDRKVYDTEVAQHVIDTLENIEIYNNLISQIKECDSKIEYYRTNESIIDSMASEKNALESDIEALTTQYNESMVNHSNVTKEIELLNAKMVSLSLDYESICELESLIKEMEDVKSQMLSMDVKMKQINELQIKLNDYTNQVETLNIQLSKLTSDKESLIVTISNIKSLEEEEIQIRQKYDLISNVRFAISPTTGLPLEFIEYYMKEEMVDKINLLLDSVYRGRFRLLKEGVDVNDKEFKIPYIKNQTTVIEDISGASDGEKAILSLAFSLVLIQLTQRNENKNYYNILLLDEKDATLDSESRGKFIDLLETYMGTIKAEQLFLVSHNNMFDSYPVNILLTGETQTFNYSKATITKLY